MILHLTEHDKYYEKGADQLAKRKDFFAADCFIDLVHKHEPLFFKNDKERPCLVIEVIDEKVIIENSYYIGLSWLHPWQRAVQVSPKVNRGETKLNHIRMLIEALKETENLNHLDDLMDIRFDEEWIEVDGAYEVELTPFLIAQFLMCLRSIVRKGIKKDYYRVTENLQSRVKGKILISQQIRQNVVRNRLTSTICSYQEYGVDTASNRFLKYVLHFVQSQVHHFKDENLKDAFLEPLAYNLGAFQRISEEKFYTFKHQENNPMYKEYNVAINLGNQILKLMDHNLSKTSERQCKYPPHWIDMSKLFELYVFKKLRERFSGSGEVQYHTKVNRQELDFIINTSSLKAVVDAKYKPRYKSGNPSIDDARQLAGYSRLNSVYRELDIEEDKLIPVYFIYPSELKDDIRVVEKETKEEEEFEEHTIEFKLLDKPMRESKAYRKMYLQEISLPVAD